MSFKYSNSVDIKRTYLKGAFILIYIISLYVLNTPP